MTDALASDAADAADNGDDPALLEAPEFELLLAPRDGMPPLIVDQRGLADLAERMAAGTGPVAVDAERASGYRYGQRAYLVQLRRAGVGSAMVDPTGCPDLSILGEAIADAEWVLHAASQDLPCLADVGMRPSRIFDTELAGRLAGFERVGLGAMVERVLGLRLEKGHSAADWSRRPLPDPWLLYAALDVEVLIELRDALEAELDGQGKLSWAHEEFAALVEAPPKEPRTDPWRRTSGIHRIRNRRQLAAVRALWEVRDELARERDIAPGRLLPDASLLAAVTAAPADEAALVAVAGFSGRGVRRHAHSFLTAYRQAVKLADADLPTATLTYDGPPPAARWADRDPDAALRLARVRTALSALAESHRLPVENLLLPDLVRRLTWEPPQPLGPDTVAAALRAGGARAWQVELTAAVVAGALEAPPADPAGVADPAPHTG
ncbi:MAG: ribonuclease [Frankiales bacterium]|nr:ribonuclease [Frankiales bacterium]